MKKTNSTNAKQGAKSDKVATAPSGAKRASRQRNGETSGKLSPEKAVGLLKDYENRRGNSAGQETSLGMDAELGNKRGRGRSDKIEAPKDADSPAGSESRKFAEALRRMRRLLEISQEELAERAGLHRNFVGAVERGEMSVSLENAGRLARALGVGLKDLL